MLAKFLLSLEQDEKVILCSFTPTSGDKYVKVSVHKKELCIERLIGEYHQEEDLVKVLEFMLGEIRDRVSPQT